MKRTKYMRAGLGSLALLSAVGFMALIAPSSLAQTLSPLQSSIQSLATNIAADAAKVHDGGLAQTVAEPMLNVLTNASFDWNEVMFGTDTLSPSQE